MLILLSMASCHWFKPEDETIYDRTVLVYIAADNNLSSWHQEDIDEMLEGAGDIPQNCRLLVYVDDTDLPRILSIEQQKGRRPVAKTVHQYTSEHNSGDTETLRLAMEWATTNCPTESYGLVLWSHGSSWVPEKAPAQRAVCQDSKAGSWMEIKDIADVLAQSPHLDFILFDACFMQAVEVAYELRHTTRYILASPAEIPGPGAPYHRIMNGLFSQPLNVDEIIHSYYHYYSNYPDGYGVVISAIDCSAIDELLGITSEMIIKHISAEEPDTNLDGIQQYAPKHNGGKHPRPNYYDMNSYMKRVLPEADYQQWKEVFDITVPYRYATEHWFSFLPPEHPSMDLYVDMAEYGGVSCYVPKHVHPHLNQKFRSTSWYHAGGWEQVGW